MWKPGDLAYYQTGRGPDGNIIVERVQVKMLYQQGRRCKVVGLTGEIAGQWLRFRVDLLREHRDYSQEIRPFRSLPNPGNRTYY